MTALSENLSKNQKARDVLESGDNLEKAGEELAHALEDGKITPEARAKVNQLLDEANKQLAQIAHALQDMPQELPEDFVNQEGMKNLDLGKSQDILSQINQAMADGDAAKALSLAQQFLQMAKNMNKQLSKANDAFTQAHSAEKLPMRSESKARSWTKLPSAKASCWTKPSASRASNTRAAWPSKPTRWRNWPRVSKRCLDKTTHLDQRPGVARSAGDCALFPIECGAHADAADRLAEMQSKRLVHTLDVLPAMVAQLNASSAMVAASSAPVSIVTSARDITQEQTVIWDELKKMSSNKTNPTAEETTQSESLKTEQSDLEQQTQQLRKKLQELSQKTASLGAPLMHSLGQAGAHMHDSSGALSEAQAPSAQKSEEQALDELRSAQDGLQQAQSMMSEMAMEQGGGSPGGQSGGGSGGIKVIARAGGPGGQQGSNNGKVRLPTAADYRPPKAFREDLLEALK